MGANQRLRRRTVWLLIIILAVGFGAVITRLAFLQLVKGEELQRRAVEQQLSDTTVSAKRGTIYDTNGKILAQSASVWRVVMAPAYFDNDEQRSYVARRLAEILDLDEQELLEDTKQSTYYVSVKRKIESDEKEQILELQNEVEEKFDKSSVISLLDDYKRYYPYSELASAVIGFTGSDDQGLSGIEYQYDKYLTGTPGRIIAAQNGIQTDMPFDYNQNIDAVDGNSVVLTIDETVQSIVEKYMLQGIADNQVHDRGVCIIMDVTNGEIIAMAVTPGYDLNSPFEISAEDKQEIAAIDVNYLAANGYLSDDQDISTLPNAERDKLIAQAKSEAESAALSRNWRNKAISDTYYPGSVFKMITLSMALEEGVVDSSSRFNCSGSYQLYNDDIHCHVYPSGHGTQTYAECLWNSCNPGFIQIGQKVGEEKFWEYYQGFGFSEKTGIDLPGESEDQFFDWEGVEGAMGPVDLAVASFGQNFSITPIQMVTAACAVCNGGQLVQPHVVKQILDKDGNVIENISTQTKRQVISKSVSDEMREILEENAIHGSGKNGYVAGYRVGGKTGTSEKLIDVNGDGVDDYIASFCGFAPANNPRYAALVFFDAPLGGNYYGSAVSAPVFASIMNEVLPYLEVVAQYTDEELANIDTTAGSYTGLSVSDATRQANLDGFDVTVRGEGSTVLAQNPVTGTTIPMGGTIVLYTDEESSIEKVTVPDLIGYSVTEVNYIAASYGINVSVTGTVSSTDSVSIAQSIEEGTEVSPGTVVTVTFTTGGIAD